MIKYKYKGKNRVLKAQEDRPMEVFTGFISENGIKRNLVKFKIERVWANYHAKNSTVSHGWFITAALNRLTEKFRRAPYTWAHLVFIGVPLLMLVEGGVLWAILH